MRFRLRTLLIVLALGPPMLAGTWLVGASALRIYRDHFALDPDGLRPCTEFSFSVEYPPGHEPY